MFSFAIRTGGLFLVLSLLWACGTPPTREAASNTNNSRTAPPTQAGANPHAGGQAAGDVEFDTPQGWTRKPGSSGMRVAEYDLPAADGDQTGATLIVYFFGQGGGGPVQDNLDRWKGQVQQPDGKDSSRVDKMQVNGLEVTLLDVSGTYNGGDMTGGGGAVPNARMRAGVIETPKGNYFIKMAGPQKTIARWDSEFMQFVKSVRLKS